MSICRSVQGHVWAPVAATRIYSFSENLVRFSGCLYWRDLGFSKPCFSGFTFYGRRSTAVRLVHLQDALNARNSQRGASNAGLYNSADHSQATQERWRLAFQLDTLIIPLQCRVKNGSPQTTQTRSRPVLKSSAACIRQL